jgi:hypothetical protein
MDSKEAYAEYLQSEHWAGLRKQAFATYGNRCSRCKSHKRLQVHHHTYRFPWENCTVKDVVPLCLKCHEKEHGIKRAEVGTTGESKRLYHKFQQEQKASRRKARNARPHSPKQSPQDLKLVCEYAANALRGNPKIPLKWQFRMLATVLTEASRVGNVEVSNHVRHGISIFNQELAWRKQASMAKSRHGGCLA